MTKDRTRENCLRRIAPLPTDAIGQHGRPHDAGVGLQAARGASAAARGCAEHSHRADRRCWSRLADHLRRRSRNSDDGPHRPRRNRLQPLPHHGDVLADARLAADRPQSSPRRQRTNRGTGQRLGRLLRDDSRGAARLPPRSSRTTATAPARWASGTTRRRWRPPRQARSRTGRRARLRILLRVPRGRGLAVRTEPGAQHHQRPAADDVRRRAITSARTWRTMPSPGCASTRRFEPDKPFYMYWASGAIHGPHHVAKEWADKYKGKFDDGWDAYRERVFRARQGEGLDSRRRPAHAAARTMPAWESIPEDEKTFPAPPDGSGRWLHRTRRRAGRPDRR